MDAAKLKAAGWEVTQGANAGVWTWTRGRDIFHVKDWAEVIPSKKKSRHRYAVILNNISVGHGTTKPQALKIAGEIRMIAFGAIALHDCKAGQRVEVAYRNMSQWALDPPDSAAAVPT